jgi:hypothetical protein
MRLKGIHVKNLDVKGNKLVVKPKRYDKCTELKLKRSPKTRPARPGELPNV